MNCNIYVTYEEAIVLRSYFKEKKRRYIRMALQGRKQNSVNIKRFGLIRAQNVQGQVDKWAQFLDHNI